MCRRLICLVSLVLVLGSLDVTRAELIGHWTLDETSGTMAVDSSGREHHGTYVNSPGLNTPGVFGTGMDSSGGYMEADLGADLPVQAEERTLAVWVNPVTGADAKFISYGNAANGGAFTFTVENVSGQDGVLFRHNGGNMFYPGIMMNEWNHTAMRVSPGTTITNELEFFINGENVPGARNAGEDRPLVTNDTAFWVGTWVGPATPFTGSLDEAYFFDHALTDAEIRAVMNGVPPGQASQPDPDDEATDVARDYLLNWQAGEFAAQHDVYFGIGFDDVNDATTTEDPAAVYRGRQSEAVYAPGRLAFDQTYYWRVDEVNSPPDNTVFKGEIWSFTSEPLAIPIENVTATASSSFGASVAENTINGSGLVDDLHGITTTDMWISAGIPATVEYTFDRAFKLHELWIWNSNQTIEPFIGFGAKDVVIEHSLDGENWTVLEGVGPLAQGSGLANYAHNNTIGFGGVTAQHVRVTINSVQGFAPQASLSEVRFFSIPTLARGPSPDSGASNVAPDLTLFWGRNGREADRHDIYVGSDPDNLPLAGNVTESSFDTLPLDLQLGETYSWRVDEVNETEDPSIWTGDIWSFTTVDTINVDNMESYRDEEFFEIWATWVDGFDDPANGSLVGNGVTGSPETGIVHGGGKSLPLHYGNGAAAQSEATRTFDAAQDWSKHGVQGLVLFFHGSVANTGGRLYVKVNDTQVVYDGDPADLQRIGFHKWTIDLAALPAATRSAVTSLTLGIDNGGAGVVYIDDILLTPETRELITPAELGPEGLVAYYPFDGDFQDASGNGRHGTGLGGALGGPIFGPGHSGQAISLDGAGQYVEITGYQGISAVDGVQQPFSVSNWFATTADGEMVTWGSSPGGQRLSWRIDVGNLRTEHGNGNLRGNTLVNDGEWHHAALVVQEGANLRVPNTTLYIDGLADGVNAGDDDPYNLTPGEDVSIGRRATSGDRFFPGSIDEVRIFDRALSAGEVAGLAGRTQAFDKP